MGILMHLVYQDFTVIHNNQIVRIRSDLLQLTDIQFNSVQREIKSA
jgi:hypothetical protein